MQQKYLPLVLIATCMSIGAMAQTGATAAPPTKAFNLSPDAVGGASNSVNLFTGDLDLPMSLIAIPGRNGLEVTVNISYSSNVQNDVDLWNLESPTGIVGLGWSMDMPRIVTDTKLTGTREDDAYYLLEDGGSSLLIRTGSGSDAIGVFYTYECKRYRFWKIKYYYDPLENGTYPNKWEIIKDNGFRFVYGDRNSGRKTVQYMVRWGNWIGNSAQLTGQSQLAIAWNLSEIINLRGEKILFEYDAVEQFVGSASGQKHTEASYLKQITDVIGRKVQFVYKEKAGTFYMEPHTEAPEPDAYQEVYERKYLDHIDVLDEFGAKYSSVYLKYSAINAGTNTAKMLLAYIEQRNSVGTALHGVQLDYGTSGDTKGFLTKVTYPSGGSVVYDYSPATDIGHSQRNLAITAPAGFAEPRTWVGPDYVVVAWRAINSPMVHDTIPKSVRLYVYEWVGEWKETFLQTIGSVSSYDADGFASVFYDYKRFQVATEEKFFAVITKSTAGNHQVFIRYKDDRNRGEWGYFTPAADYGAGMPSVITGDNFIVIGSFQDDSTHPCHLYTWQGNSFKDDVLNQTIGDHYYTGTNNYFISHNRAGVSGQPEVNFSYLDAEKGWHIRNWNSTILFNSTSFSAWYGSNSFATVMAGQNPEFIYDWDLTYTNFIKNTNLLGAISDDSFVWNISNAVVGATERGAGYGKIARYDGKYWYGSADITPYFYERISYGDDYAIWTVDDRQRPVVGYLRTFNPNTLTWSDVDMSYQPNQTLFGNSFGHNTVKASNGFFAYNDKIYFRKQNGTWSPDYTFTPPPSGEMEASSLRVGDKFFVYRSGGVKYLQMIKNGAIGQLSSSFSGTYDINIAYSAGRYSLLGGNTMVTYAGSNMSDATTLYLYKVVAGGFQNKIKDTPVVRVTVNDGNKNYYTSFAYDFPTAAIDKSGRTAYYYKVTTVAGSSTTAAKPFGSSISYFQTGVSTVDLGVSYHPTELNWVGVPYRTESYDASGTLVSFTETTFTTFYKDIMNSVPFKVDVASYVRPTYTLAMSDNITMTVSRSYDDNTGQVKSETSDYSPPVSAVRTEYTYWWEKYDPTRSRNILKGVVQTAKNVANVYTESQVTRWKNWTASLSSSTEPGPYDAYIWKGTGAAPNTFSTWDIATAPGSDWESASKISQKDDATGVVLEQIGKGNISLSLIWDEYKLRKVASVGNGLYSKIAFTSFEDNSKGNWTWTDGAITAGASRTGTKYYSLGTTGLTKSGLTSTDKYVISFWAKSSNGVVVIDGVPSGPVTINQSNWTLYEYTVTGLTSLTIKLSGSTPVQIDEVRLFPVNARMVTTTYHPTNGATSTTDSNNITTYTEYDEWGRVKNLVDNYGNIVKTNSFYTRN